MDQVFKHYFDYWRKLKKLPPELSEVSGYLYDNLPRLNVWRNNFRGLVTELPALNMTLQGAIDDLLVSPEGRYAPLDFKTRGFPTKEDTHEHYRHQLNLYALLLEANGLPPAEKGYLLFFHPTAYRGKGVAYFETKLIEMPLDLASARLILQEVRHVVDGPLPRAHTDCVFCHYREGFE
jgi:RecB family exonuclease